MQEKDSCMEEDKTKIQFHNSTPSFFYCSLYNFMYLILTPSIVRWIIRFHLLLNISTDSLIQLTTLNNYTVFVSWKEMNSENLDTYHSILDLNLWSTALQQRMQTVAPLRVSQSGYCCNFFVKLLTFYSIHVLCL
jgi:hypothetical protein